MRSFHVHLIAGLVLFILWIVPAEAKNIKIIREGGNGDGYGYVREFHGTDAEGGDVLMCRDPGSKECAWRVKPEYRLIPYAEQQILNGVLSGEYGLIENGIFYHVTWTAIDIFNCTIEETQGPAIS